MNSYSNILKHAYHLTKSKPVLWLLGMFVIGSFNLNFLNVRGFLPKFHLAEFSIPAVFWYFERHPAGLAVISLLVLVFALASLVLTNWSRVMLLLVVKSVMDKKYFGFAVEAKKSRFFLWPVIQVSVITSAFMLAAVLVLIAPVLVEDPLSQSVLWVLGAVIFLFLLFAVSSLNIFTTMFIVVLKIPLKNALNSATDFFVANWTDFLGLTAVLLAIYLVGFALGTGFLGLIRLSARIIIDSLPNAGFLQFSPLFTIIKALGAVLLWIVLGILNAFINTALLLFFLQKITPVKFEEKQEASQVVPSLSVP